MICCENDVKILWTQHFFLIPQISATIIFLFPPILAMPLPQLLKKKFYSPISAMALPQFVCQKFFFPLFTSGTPRTGSRTGQRKFGITVAKIQHFLSPRFSSFLSYFQLNFGNGNTEIQSLSSKSQITLNSTYNAN